MMETENVSHHVHYQMYTQILLQEHVLNNVIMQKGILDTLPIKDVF